MIIVKLNGENLILEDRVWTSSDGALQRVAQSISDHHLANRGGYVPDMELFLAAAVVDELGADAIDMSRRDRPDTTEGVVY